MHRQTELTKQTIATGHMIALEPVSKRSLRFETTENRRFGQWQHATLRLVLGLALAVANTHPATCSSTEDWPTFRHDVTRSGSTPAALPTNLQIHWRVQLSAPQPAWPATQTKLQFDAGPNVVSVGGRVFVSSSADDSVTAFSTDTGEMLWRCFAGGPVRFAPAATRTSVYFVSDDGFLYCVDALNGHVKWSMRGGPEERWVLGNERLISSWPARGGPVLHDGVVYFAAGLWPMMGIFVHAVEADTGRVLWTNGGHGSDWTVGPHNAPAFSALCPQGHLLVAGQYLIVPGGRSVPAVFDRHTGEKLAFTYDKKKGNHFVFTSKGQLHVGGASYRLHDGTHLADEMPDNADGHQLIFGIGNKIASLSVESRHEVIKKSRLGKTTTTKKLIRETLFNATTSVNVDRILVKTRNFVVSALGKDVHFFALQDLKASPAHTVTPRQSFTFQSDVFDAIVANQRLFVTTKSGELICVGGLSPISIAVSRRAPQFDSISKPPPEAAHNRARHASRSTGPQPALGYLVLFEPSDASLDEALARSPRPIIVLDPSSQRVRQLRESLTERGIYGRRVMVKLGSIQQNSLPRYLAGRVETSSPKTLATNKGIELLRHILRPYGGCAVLSVGEKQVAKLSDRLSELATDGLESIRDGSQVTIRRTGPLQDSGQWTHQYGDGSQSGISTDALVKAPLGVLWFGGPSNDKVLPRHGHGPSPQVAGGRIVIEGRNMLRALDAYTGRLIWETDLPDLGRYYDTTKHFPGAGEIGSNYVTLPDSVYVVYGQQLLKLSAVDGAVREFARTDQPEENWGYIGVMDDTLIATAAPLKLKELVANRSNATPLTAATTLARYSSGSLRMVAFNRHSGKRLWSRDARHNFRHNNIALSQELVFAIDRFSDEKRKSLSRRGVTTPNDATLTAFDVATGDVVWKQEKDIFGTFLSYSAKHDILLQAGSLYRDRAYDETGKGMIAYRGKTGEVLWQDTEASYRGPCLLWKDQVITNGAGGSSRSLFTGKPTGLNYSRKYGCNTAIGCQNLLTFRSGAAGYFDLLSKSGTSNLGGFRSSCTNNLIPADGLLCAPDYTRTCNCAFQNQTSVAFIHSPDAEQWSYGATAAGETIGLNFAAPGDRRAPNGTLWLDAPSVGGESPDLDVRFTPEEVRSIRHSPTIYAKSELPWVFASGIEGVDEIRIPSDQLHGTFKVRLFFAELDRTRKQTRIVAIALKGQRQEAPIEVALDAPRVVEATLRVAGEVAIKFLEPSESLINGIEMIPVGRTPAPLRGHASP